jgi:protein-S-isoprenylcysteine O-methyltransferase Ste14
MSAEIAWCWRRAVITLGLVTARLNVVAIVVLAVCWVAFTLTWLIGAIIFERGAPAERTRSRFGSALGLGTVIVAVVILAVPKPDWRFVLIETPWARLLGLAVVVAATAFAIWARLKLGAMWSAAPTVKEDHALQTGGPYRLTRHPIYTGILGMQLGSLLAAGGGRWIVPFPIFLLLFEIKIHIEERLMLAEFPNDYPRYRQRVPQLIPGLRLPSRQRMEAG